MEKFDLLTLGEVLLRLSPKENKRIVRSTEFESHVGGAELNVSSGVSLLGLHTGIISKLPANAIGELARSKVRSMNVSDDYLVWDHTEDARLGSYFYESATFPRKPQVVYDRKHSSITRISIDEFPEEMYTSATSCLVLLF